MKSSHKFSWQFDKEKLEQDLASADQDWVDHFNTDYYQGEWSGLGLRIPKKYNHLLNPGDNDTVYEDTPLLEKLPYVRHILNYFRCEVTSARLLKLTAGSVIKKHKDPDLSYWNGLARIHIPITTNDLVKFIIDDSGVKMLPGECWFAEFCLPHYIENKGTCDRVHLVIDLKVNEWLKELFEREGILSFNEPGPNPGNQFSAAEKSDIFNTLVAMGTPSATTLAHNLYKPSEEVEQSPPHPIESPNNDQEKKVIFLHIHRTGGTTITQLLRQSGYSPTQVIHGELPSVKIPMHRENIFIFTFARNPWDRLLSWYFYLHQHAIQQDNGFNRFIDELLEENKEAPVNEKFLCNQLDYLTDQNDQFLPDEVGRFEQFEYEVRRIFGLLSIPIPSIPKLNDVSKPKYKDFYDQETMEKVAQLCKKDILYFNYKF